MQQSSRHRQLYGTNKTQKSFSSSYEEINFIFFSERKNGDGQGVEKERNEEEKIK
jgi:hypothetical protein